MFESDLIGQTLGSYTIISKIGQGGMAVVYKAYEASLERFVAVKVLPPSLAMESGFNTRFEREAKAIAKLDHPNILPVYGYGHHDGLSYLVMRFVPAGTLKEKMHQPLDLTYIAEIMRQIGRALEYAHHHGVIHRDIKPSNILMADDDWPLLTDFGLAKMMESPSHLTGTGVGVGTPAYMSPEQAQGLEVDGRTDIYSLGIMLYEMVIGKVPYEADTPMAVMLKHINTPLPLPSHSRPDLPEAIENVIVKALAKNPEDRFQTVTDFIKTLDAAISHSEKTEAKNDLPLEITASVPPLQSQPILSGQPAGSEAAPFVPDLTKVSPAPEASRDTIAQPVQKTPPALDKRQPVFIETAAKETSPKNKGGWLRKLQPWSWKIGTGLVGIVIVMVIFIWGLGIIPGFKMAVSPTAQMTIPIANSSHPLPSPIPVKPSFIIKITSSSDFANITFARNLYISASNRIAVSGDPSYSTYEGGVIRLFQDIYPAYVGHQISATYEIALLNYENFENLDNLVFSINKGCIGSVEVEIHNVLVEPAVVVFRKISTGCQTVSLSTPAELLKTPQYNAETTWVDPPMPTMPPELETDESKYVFTCFDTQPSTQQLCMVKGRSGQLMQLTNDFNYNELGWSQWTADGKGIYYSARTLPNGPWSTYVINADGTGVKKVMDAYLVAYSPDNQTIAYSNDCVVLRLAKSDGNDRHYLNTSGVRCMDWIRWSPDGSQLTFVDVVDFSIWVINQDGTGLHRIYQFETPLWGFYGLAWNPEGKSIGVWYEVKENTGRLGLLLDATGVSEPQPIGWDMPTWWTPAFWPQWGD